MIYKPLTVLVVDAQYLSTNHGEMMIFQRIVHPRLKRD